jgi:hypothetical protein
MLSACIQGVGVMGPGIGDWLSAAAILRGDTAYAPSTTVLPEPAALPPAERRRAGRVIRLALAVGAQAIAAGAADPRGLPTVFSSSSGDGENCHEICVALARGERQLSPTRFHNSVHNAASGYWSIAYRCPEASTALCAHDASFGAGLLEALVQLARSRAAVLLLSYDVDYPPPMRWRRPIPDAFGIALLLTAPESISATPPLARLHLSFTDAPAALMRDRELEALRRQIPAARGLPLLERLARRESGSVALDYLDGQRLQLEVAT